jgi:hypothetical protein
MKKPKFIKSIARSLGESMLKFSDTTPADMFGMFEDNLSLRVFDESHNLEQMIYRAVFGGLSRYKNSLDYIKKREESKAHNEAYRFIQKLVKVNQKIEDDCLITWINCKVAFINQDEEIK